MIIQSLSMTHALCPAYVAPTMQQHHAIPLAHMQTMMHQGRYRPAGEPGQQAGRYGRGDKPLPEKAA